MDSTAMITACAWVPRGFAAQFPLRKELDENEFERIAGLAKLQLDEAKEVMAGAKGGGVDEMEIEEEDEIAEQKESGGGKGGSDGQKK